MVAPTMPPPLTSQELRELVRRVDANDEAAIAELRQQLQHPAVADRWGGNWPAIIEVALMNRLGEVSRHLRMAVAAKLQHLRESLALPTESPILQLLAERVATSWLHLHVLEWKASRCRDQLQHKHMQQMVDRVHRRYLTALKTLAEIRRLNLPAIQVNVAQQQVVVGRVVSEVVGEDVVEEVRKAMEAAG